MAIGSAPIQQAQGSAYGTATTAALAFSGNVVSGSRLIVVATCSDSPAAPTCTDTQGNTYTRRAVSNNAGTNYSTMVFDAPSGTAGANTVTVASNIGGVSNWTVRIYEWAGIDDASPYVGTNVANSSTTTPSTGTVTPGVDGCLFLASMDGQATIAVDAPFVNLATVGTNISDDYYIQGTAAALECTWTDGAGWSLGRLVVYAPAVSGPTVDTQPTAQTARLNGDATTTATFACASSGTGTVDQTAEIEDSVGSGTYATLANGSGATWSGLTATGSGSATQSLVGTFTATTLSGRRVRIKSDDDNGTQYSDAVVLTVLTGPVLSASSGTGVGNLTLTSDDPLTTNGEYYEVVFTATDSGAAVNRTSARPV